MKYLSFFAFIAAFATSVVALPGDLDATFGINGGYLLSNFESLTRDEKPRDVAIQPDGRILIVGSRTTTVPGAPEMYVARYNADGTPDTTFSSDGFVNNGSAFRADAVAIQPDGKIVVVGGLGETTNSAYIWRLNPDGTSDSTFDTDGFTQIISSGQALAVVLQPDGKIVFTTAFNGGALPAGYLSMLVRLNTNGSLDTTFDGDGRRLISDVTNSTVYNGRGLALQPDGKFVVAGQTTPNLSHGFSVFRFLSSGLPDATFNGGGRILPSGTATSVAIQSDGKVVVAGGLVVTSGEEATLMRLNDDGSFDNTFDGDGILTKELTGNNEDYPINDVAIQADGKILALAAGDSVFSDFVGNDYFMFRSNSDGSTDNSFDYNGIAKSQWCELASDLALATDGKIVTSAARDRVRDGISNRAACVQRYNTNGSVDYGFSSVASDGKLAINIGRLTDINAVATLPNGKIIVAGADEEVGIVGGVVMRLNANGSLDTSFMNEGFYGRDDNTSTSDTIFYDVRVLPDGGFLIAGASDLNGGLLVKFTPAGTPDATFSGDGFANSTNAARFHAALVQPDGKILGCGSSGSTSRTGRILRFSSTGAFETAVSNTMGRTGTDSDIFECAFQSNGNVVVAGYGLDSATSSDFVSVSRHLPNLTVDTTFGTAGVAKLDLSPTFDDRATDLVIQPDDKIVVSSTGLNGGGDRDFAVVRFEANGAPDLNLTENFGTNGVSLIDFIVGNPNDEANALLLQPDGQVLVAGSTNAGTGPRFGLAKINPGGAPALGFGTLGRAAAGFPNNDATALAASFYLNNGVLVAGRSWNGFDYDFAIARIQNEFIPTAASVEVSGRVTTAKGAGIANVVVSLTDLNGNVRSVKTNTFGIYRFDELVAGESYVLNVTSKRFSFESPSRLVTVKDSVFDADFTAVGR